jgi:hypothetical protein
LRGTAFYVQNEHRQKKRDHDEEGQKSHDVTEGIPEPGKDHGLGEHGGVILETNPGDVLDKIPLCKTQDTAVYDGEILEYSIENQSGQEKQKQAQVLLPLGTAS